jgi:hypothetical protein
MKEAVAVNVSIERSAGEGFATWIRSQDNPKVVWWKWYGAEVDAYKEAEQLSFVIVQTVPQGLTQLVRRRLKEKTSIDPDILIALGFFSRPVGRPLV